MMRSSPEAGAKLRLIWFAQLVAVLVMTGLALYLPSLGVVVPQPEVQLPLLIVGGLSFLAILILGRVLGLGGSRPDVRLHRVDSHLDEARSAAPPLARWLLLFALAELPTILGFVLVFLGGQPGHAILLGVSSCVILLVYRPRD